MDVRKRPPLVPAGPPPLWPSFLQQPPRVLIVEVLPPWWSESRGALCEALDNFLCVAASLDGPPRLPLLSLYVSGRQPECLLPFTCVRGNLSRLRSCVEELRSLRGEGCVSGGPSGGGGALTRAVLDGLLQYRQYTQHTSRGAARGTVEVTVVTSQQDVVGHLEAGLKGSDLGLLRRLLVVQVATAGEWGPTAPSPGQAQSPEDSVMMGAEVDLQQVENSAVAMEAFLKAWLHEQGGDREHLQLFLPAGLNKHSEKSTPVCVKCDMQERHLSPALFPLNSDLGVGTESLRDFLPLTKPSANHSSRPQRLRALKALRADGVCESVLYGQPFILRPSCGWQLDWDDMENNQHLFNALCHTLRGRDLFLLVRLEPVQSSAARDGSAVFSHYVLQPSPSPSVSLLLKPVVSRELMLPCSLPVAHQDPPPQALSSIQASLAGLQEEVVFNPLCLSSNLYTHLRSRRTGTLCSYRSQPPGCREQPQPLEGAKSTHTRQPRQAGVQLLPHRRVRATVAPLPSSGPPPHKAPRPPLTLSTRAPAAASSSSSSSSVGAPTRLCQDLEDDELMML